MVFTWYDILLDSCSRNCLSFLITSNSSKPHSLGMIWLSTEYLHGMGICTFPDMGSHGFCEVDQILGIVCNFPYLLCNMRIHSSHIFHELGKIFPKFFKNSQPGNDMAFHRILPCYGNLYIPRHWGLHEVSLILNL